MPWSGLKAKDSKEHNKMIYSLKQFYSAEDLCEGHPVEYIAYLKHVRSLDFDEDPLYGKMRHMFKTYFHMRKYKDDGVYDWNH